MDATVFESRRELFAEGAGLGLLTNGLRVLRALGTIPLYLDEPDVVRTVTLEVEGGKVLSRLDYSAIGPSDAGIAAFLRADLLRGLADHATAAGAELRLGALCEAVESRPGKTVLHIGADAESFDAVVCADGIRSRLRVALGLPGEPRLTGAASLRGVVERSTRRPEMRELWTNDGRRFGFLPLGRGKTYFFCSAPANWDEVQSRPATEWARTWSYLDAEVAEIVEDVTHLGSLRYDRIWELRRCSNWFARGCFLVGDAAHAMTPDLGQGGNSAMVDSLVLIRLLASSGSADLKDVAQEYDRVRRRFVSRVQFASRQMAAWSTWSNPALRVLRASAMRMSSKSRFAQRRSIRLTMGLNGEETPLLS